MNNIHCSVWNAALGAWVAVPGRLASASRHTAAAAEEETEAPRARRRESSETATHAPSAAFQTLQ